VDFSIWSEMTSSPKKIIPEKPDRFLKPVGFNWQDSQSFEIKESPLNKKSAKSAKSAREKNLSNDRNLRDKKS